MMNEPGKSDRLVVLEKSPNKARVTAIIPILPAACASPPKAGAGCGKSARPDLCGGTESSVSLPRPSYLASTRPADHLEDDSKDTALMLSKTIGPTRKGPMRLSISSLRKRGIPSDIWC